MPTTVVNVRSGVPYDVYIGRGGPFGNPSVIGPDGDRDEVIRKFNAYFHGRLEIDPDFQRKVKVLKGKILGCFCRPINGFNGQLLCHGQIIAGFLDGVPPESIS